jgi:hypothetical protein
MQQSNVNLNGLRRALAMTKTAISKGVGGEVQTNSKPGDDQTGDDKPPPASFPRSEYTQHAGDTRPKQSSQQP